MFLEDAVSFSLKNDKMMLLDEFLAVSPGFQRCNVVGPNHKMEDMFIELASKGVQQLVGMNHSAHLLAQLYFLVDYLNAAVCFVKLSHDFESLVHR